MRKVSLVLYAVVVCFKLPYKPRYSPRVWSVRGFSGILHTTIGKLKANNHQDRYLHFPRRITLPEREAGATGGRGGGW